MDEELEQVWSGKKTAKEALDSAVEARQRAARTLREGQQGLTPHRRPAVVWAPTSARLAAPGGDEAGPTRGRLHLAVEKRVLFQLGWLPWALLAPQVAVIAVFFFWPAAQALLQSFQQQDAFGTSTEWVGLENFSALFADTTYLASFKTTAVFSVLVAGLGHLISLLLAVFADRVVAARAVYKHAADLALRRGAGGGRRAVAVHVRAVDRHRRLRAARHRHRLEPPAERRPRDDADRASPRSGSRSPTTSCSSSPGCSRSRSR